MDTKLLATALLTLTLLPLAACDDAELLDSTDDPLVESGELSEAEVESLRWMREEEKLARDVYLTLATAYDDNQFAKVPESEQRHMDAVAELLDRYDIEDPVVDDSVGAFVNPTLADLYVELTQTGMASQEAALRVGAGIEELDMVDLQAAIDETDEDAIIATYEQLLCGSRNHLRGFLSGLEQLDVDYEPQYLDPERFAAIVEAAHEQC